ncbi:MAG: serine/threonine protein kinase, partial [Anaeromyxobacteraceae bacterium]|nr:serine/threonine protein kinase [Anaeromyxobacteraceae bacterium]
MAAPGSPESARDEGVHPGGSPGPEDGRIVGARYRLLRQLGAGGMGSVYLCEHVALGRRYAMKVLHVGRGRDGELSGRFRQEAQAASRIAQENVVQVVDYGEDEGGDLYYVMELLEGRTLSQLMREEGPLTLPRALTLLEQVCRALAAAHAAGVVHRDVKPDNVLVERLADGSERAKLIDFGISHLADTRRITMVGEIIGTPEYMAPEQAAGSGIDELTDVYAAGVLAFELLTGSLPLLGATPIATLVAHQTQPPPAPSTRRALPPEVDGLVLRALAKAKRDRFPSMQAFAAEVRRVRLSASLAAVSRR